MDGPDSVPPPAARAAGGPTHRAQTGGRSDPPSTGLSAHILPTSATMIGVCLTALYIGLLGPAGTSRVMVDKLLAVDALVFLVSATLSFVSMRSGRRGRRFEARAEAIFLAGLVLLALVALVLAFAVD